MDSNGHKEAFSRAAIEGLRDQLTMLDIYRARKTTKDQVEVGLEAYHQAATRTGLVAPDATLEDFLGRLRADDFNEIMGASKEASPLAIGGASAPASSDGTE